MLNKPQNTLVADYEHVVDSDPCFDTEAPGWSEAWEQYLDSGDWTALPRSGEPTVFTLRHLRGKAKVKIQGLLADAQTRFMALYMTAQYAIVSIKGATLNGKPVAVKPDRDPETGTPRVPEHQMAQFYEAWPEAILDVATRAIGKMSADPP